MVTDFLQKEINNARSTQENVTRWHFLAGSKQSRLAVLKSPMGKVRKLKKFQ
jgi:hypothetical protein